MWTGTTAMSELKSMAKQSSHYFLAYALSMVASFITFPIFTRLFSVSDYGILGLISTTVFFVMATAKLGIQNSIIRFYGEVKAAKKEVSLRSFYSTLTFGPLVLTAAACVLYALTVVFIKGHLSDPRAVNFFLLSSIWAFFLCSNTIIKNFLRAEQNTGLHNVLSVISKYSSLILGVLLVYYVFKSLFGLYLAFIITEAGIFVYLLLRLYKREKISIAGFDKKFFKESLSYGFPLVGAELTSIILNAGDRYVILFYMSTTAVGLYSAGYDLAMSVVESLIFPLSYAVTPIYMKIYAEKGKAETSEFLSNCLRYFMLVALPCIFGLNILGKEITVLLASQKFEQAYRVIPYVSWGVLFYGLSSIFSAGLLIEKKNYYITLCTVIAGILNIGLNFALIPYMGFVGSALATLIAYLFLFIVIAKKSAGYLPISIDYRNIGKYLLFSFVMMGVLSFLHYDKVLTSIIMKSITGFLAYLMLILVFDGEVRAKLEQLAAGKRIMDIIGTGKQQ
jgi:O-antigen/teichoic acid export membrane protein